jgi:acyl carrier protein
MTEQIRQILSKSAGIPADSLAVDADLYQAGLKSLATVRVMMALESTFQIEFPGELLGRDTFASIGQIEQVVRQLGACHAAT